MIALTSFLDDDKVLPAVRAGAAGYLLKDVGPPELVARDPHRPRGRGAAPPRGRRARARGGRGAAPPRGAAARTRGLTPREREVLALVARGLANKRDRPGARHRREDGEDPREPDPAQARRRRPHAGGAVRGRARASRRLRAYAQLPMGTAAAAGRSLGVMPTALITGASRGLGRALAERPRRPRLAARDRRPRRRRPRGGAGRAGRADGGGRAGRRRGRPEHRAALVEACGGDARRARQQREHPRPEPAAARWTSYPLDGAGATCSRPTRSPRSASSSARSRCWARAGGSSTSPPTPPSRPTPAGAATARRRPRSSSSRAMLAEERPSCASTPYDPGDMRTQMHQDAFPGEDISDRPPPEDSVPGLLRLLEGDLPSGRYTAGARADDERGRLARARHARGARPAAPRATPSACSSPACRPGRVRARALRRPARAARRPATCSSSTPRRRCRPRSPPAAPTAAALTVHLSTPLPGEPAAGSWSCAARAGALRDGARRRAARAPRRRRGHARRAVSAARGCGSPSSRLPRAAARLSAPPRRADPLRATSTARWPLAAYQTVFATRARERRDAERRPAVHRARWSRALAARGIDGRAARAPRRRLVARAGRGAVRRAVPRAARHRARS